MSLFRDLGVKIYGEGWHEVAAYKLAEEDLKDISSAKITMGEHGKNVCFILRSGGKAFIPLAKGYDASVDAKVDPKDVRLVVLARDGEDDIVRAKI